MSKWKLRAVIAVLLCSCVVTGCGGKKKNKTENKSNYNTLGFKKGDGGWYYKEGDTTGYYDKYGNRFEKGEQGVAFDDMVFNYLRAISILDFSSAYKYLTEEEASTVISDYLQNKVDDEISDGSVSTNTTTFNRKIYKKFLLSIEVLGIEDTVYAGDSNIVTVNIRHCDLTNTDFWRDDYEQVMESLIDINENSNSYDEIGTETVDYLTDYILKAFSKKNAPKKESQVEIVITKNDLGSWQISSDSDLAELARNNNGSYIIDKIESEFRTYYEDWRDKKNN